jgi:hypothetical protein
MPTNKFSGACDVCHSMVPANGGTLHRHGRRYSPRHIACSPGSQGVTTIVLHGDRRPVQLTQNRRGRCEDAPCCGCCTC